MITVNGTARQVPDEPPRWATEAGAPLPLGFIPRNPAMPNSEPDKFFLGEPGKRALVLLGANWREVDPEQWVNFAGGCWRALVGTDCDREMAEVIAKGWLTAAAQVASRRIILPAAAGTH